MLEARPSILLLGICAGLQVIFCTKLLNEDLLRAISVFTLSDFLITAITALSDVSLAVKEAGSAF